MKEKIVTSEELESNKGGMWLMSKGLAAEFGDSSPCLWPLGKWRKEKK